MQNKLQNQNNIIYRLNIRKKSLVAFLLVASLIVLFDASPLGGNYRFYSKWLSCGQRPVKFRTAPGAGIAWYEETKGFEPFRLGYETYYCTPSEASAAGLRTTQDAENQGMNVEK
ncbi:MAG: hypothetical protein QG549_109 [Patescibacteria group bacterium]|nr:hypothetical protein [Patescibacteria group bacterium]